MKNTANGIRRIRLSSFNENPLLFIIISILLVLALIYAIWFFVVHEKKYENTYDANDLNNSNIFYAAELYLNQTHQDEENKTDDTFANSILNSNVKDFDNIVLQSEGAIYDDNATLIVKDVNTNLSIEQIQNIEQWIKQGGHLVTFSSAQLTQENWQDISTRIEQLKQEEADIDQIRNDVELNSLLEDTTTSNSLLSYFGIYDVRYDSIYESPIGGLGETELFSEFASQLNPNFEEKIAASDKVDDYVNEAMNSLESFKSVTFFNTHPDADTAYAMTNDLKLSHLKPEAFHLLYQNEQPYQQINAANAKQIRNYFTGFINKLTNTDNIHDAYHKALAEAIIALPDDELVDLFLPINDVMFDSSLGDGRITVLSNNDVLTNPDPKKITVRSRYQTKLAPDNKQQISSDIVYSSIFESLNRKEVDSFFSNYNSLLMSDNAIFLDALTTLSDSVWLLPDNATDNLMMMLWRSARLTLFGLLMVVFVFLWASYNRFGKTLQVDDGSTYDIFKYFTQVAHFGWQLDNGVKLIKPSKNQVEKLVLKRLNIAHLSANDIRKLHTLLLNAFDEKLALINDMADKPIDTNPNNKPNSNTELQDVSALNALKPLLTENNLNDVLLSTKQSVREFNPKQMLTYTQTLWLIKYLLK